MQESTTCMAILEEGIEKGIEKGIRETLLRQGQKRFGPPAEALKARLEAIHSIHQLQELADRLLDVSTWEELLGE